MLEGYGAALALGLGELGALPGALPPVWPIALPDVFFDRIVDFGAEEVSMTPPVDTLIACPVDLLSAPPGAVIVPEFERPGVSMGLPSQ